MKKLAEILRGSDRNQVALGHFNVSDLVTLNAVFSGARELGVPILVGASESERAFMGVNQIAALVRSLQNEFDYPIYLNADHTHSLQKAEKAAKAGFDMIVFDRSEFPFNENVRDTRQAVEAVKSIRPDIVVEGEIGYIGSGSEIHDKPPREESSSTNPDEAKQFVDATKVDVLAPAVGTMHGLLRSMVRREAEKHLDLQAIVGIKKATGIFLTLHGGSGTNSEDLRAAINAGITIVHINTELRLAWRQGVEKALAANADELAPYHLLRPSFDRIKTLVRERLALFNNA